MRGIKRVLEAVHLFCDFACWRLAVLVLVVILQDSSSCKAFLDVAGGGLQ